MVAKITATARLGDVLKYNEKKVLEGKAVLLHSSNFLQDTPRLTSEEKMDRFQRLHELNPRSEVNTVHITLNFAPQDQLSRRQLVEIADKYMHGLHMGKQPYLVYEHKDAAHPHLHIVSSLIKPEGERMRTHNLAKTHSETIRKQLEAEYHLTPASGRKAQDPRLQLTTDKIARGIDRVTQEYRFSNLEEYSAALRTFHVAVGGGSELATGKRKGLYYATTDDQGKKNSPPVMGTRIGPHATLPEIQKQFEKGKETPNADLAYTRQAIDWTMREGPQDGYQFARSIYQAGINMVMDHDKETARSRVTYVDHVNKTVVPEEKLGEKYSFQNLVARLTKNTPDPAQKPDQKKPQEKEAKEQEPHPFGETFQLKGPNVLSFLMNADPQFSPSQDLDEDPDLKKKHRPRL